MAKKKAAGVALQVPEERVEEQNGHATALIEIPLADADVTGYEANQASAGRLPFEHSRGIHVNAQLSPAEAETFLRIRSALRGQNAKLTDGRPVFTNVDVLRWVMGQLNPEGDD